MRPFFVDTCYFNFINYLYSVICVNYEKNIYQFIFYFDVFIFFS